MSSQRISGGGNPEYGTNSFSETERNLKVRIDRDDVRQFLPHPAVAAAAAKKGPSPTPGAPPHYLQPLAPIPGSSFSVAMSGDPASAKAQALMRRKLLREITQVAKSRSPHPSPAPGAHQPVDAATGAEGQRGGVIASLAAANEQRIQSEGAKVQRRLVKLTSSEAPAHSLAPFMKDITAFVEAQLQRLDAQFPSGELPRHVPSTFLVPAEIAAKRTGCSEPTREELKRKLRLDVFLSAERMFADSFKTYKLFLDAIADEHQSYVNFLQDDLTLHKEVLLGMRDVVAETKRGAAEQVERANAERDRIIRELETEHKALLRWRQTSEEQAVKEKSRESALKNQLMELENRTREQELEIRQLRAEVESLNRQNQSLLIGTFSDSLENANNAIAELRAQNATKDEALAVAHDEYAELAKDLRVLADYYQRLTETELQGDDVQLTAQGFRVLFPELARKRRLGKLEGGKGAASA